EVEGLVEPVDAAVEPEPQDVLELAADLGEEPRRYGADHPHYDRDELHEVVRGWRRVLDDYDGDRLMVAEAWVEPDRLPLYLRPDEYHQAFNFDLLNAPFDATAFRSTIDDALSAAVAEGSIPTWVLSNHDVMRHTTRYGLDADQLWITWPLDGNRDALDPERGLRRARASLLMLLALPGSVYLYQGEELGLPEVWDLDEDVLDDPVWEMSGHTLKGRDGCRVPLPWTDEPPALGFGDSEPWLPQPERFAALAASRQDGDPGSTLELYRRLLRLRSEHLPGDDGLTWLDGAAGVLDYRRGNGLRCTLNTGDTAVAVPAGRQLANSVGPDPIAELEPDTAVWTLAD
ncbi:MAG: alpha-amylase family glycosyl hydrolase, partial [Actinomycetota bacterium]